MNAKYIFGDISDGLLHFSQIEIGAQWFLLCAFVTCFLVFDVVLQGTGLTVTVTLSLILNCCCTQIYLEDFNSAASRRHHLFMLVWMMTSLYFLVVLIRNNKSNHPHWEPVCSLDCVCARYFIKLILLAIDLFF